MTFTDKMCPECHDSGATDKNAEHGLDCRAPGCDAVARRMAFDNYLRVQRPGGVFVGSSDEHRWGIFKHAFGLGVEAARASLPAAAGAVLTEAQITHIGEQWDGCEYDGPSGMIDIGEAIRIELKKLKPAAAAPDAQPDAWMTEDGRVVHASTMAGAKKDGGALLSSMRPFNIALYRHAAAAQPEAKAAPAGSKTITLDYKFAADVLGALFWGGTINPEGFEAVKQAMAAVMRGEPAPWPPAAPAQAEACPDPAACNAQGCINPKGRCEEAAAPAMGEELPPLTMSVYGTRTALELERERRACMALRQPGAAINLSKLLEEVADVLSGNNWRGDLVDALREAATAPVSQPGTTNERERELKCVIADLTAECKALRAAPVSQPAAQEPVKWSNGCNETVPKALRYLARYPRPSGGEEHFNAAHWLQLADEIERMARKPLYTAPQPLSAPAGSEQEAALAPATLSDSHIKMIAYGEGIDSTVALRFARAVLAAAGNSQGLDAKDAALFRWLGENPSWSVRWRIHTKKQIQQWQMVDDGEPWGQWGEHREVISAACKAYPSAPVGGSHG